MAYIYTCQECGRQYSVYQDGEYVCDCGCLFEYPVATAGANAGYATAAPVFIDSSSRGVKRDSYIAHRGGRALLKKKQCPLATVSLIMAVLSIPLFGVLALPALIFGVAARIMIADRRFRYYGDGTAVAGIVIATFAIAGWAVWVFRLF
ncbi:MAG: DUF4190 domain-containing protein [Kiritimatiellaeota bacterium]|nr:DUF4190 domain-containing protein [Kiritimatiellota bacterium]